MNTPPPAPPPLLVPETDDLFGHPTRGTWMLFAMMAIVKIGVLTVVLMYDRSEMTALIAVVSSWLWIVGAVVLLSGPVAYAWRIRRVRARRAALQREEWMLESREHPKAH